MFPSSSLQQLVLMNLPNHHLKLCITEYRISVHTESLLLQSCFSTTWVTLQQSYLLFFHFLLTIVKLIICNTLKKASAVSSVLQVCLC